MFSKLKSSRGKEKRWKEKQMDWCQPAIAVGVNIVLRTLSTEELTLLPDSFSFRIYVDNGSTDQSNKSF